MHQTLKKSVNSGLALGLALFWIVNASAQVDFRRDVQPILSNKCYACHGPDANTREGGFRLDVKESAFGEADSGERPIVAKKPQDSELIRRIQSTGYDQMPPANVEKQLTAAEKKILKQWIAEGAKWQGHWAFEPIQRPALPKVAKKAWPKNGIDYFVLSKLEKAGRFPQAEASRETLIRRVSFDLTGLPPTPSEIDAFLKDKSDNAYEKVVDRLLASSRYGELLASRWLDAARFADTNGYQNDFSRHMWPWRDWVIRAYNQNMRFDRFVIEQIAGDMLPNATLSQKIATGFNRNHRTVTEGGSIEQEWLVENVVDRVETTATVFLGLTMGCARCHDHKYDPISQKEFYQFFAYFYNVEERGFHSERRGNVPPFVKVTGPAHTKKLAEFDRQIKELKQQLSSIKQSLSKKQLAWEASFANKEHPSPPNDQTVSVFAGGQSSIPKPIEKRISAKPKSAKKTPFGNSIQISGKDRSQFDLADAFPFNGSRAFSVSVWVRPRKFGAIISRMDAGNNYRGFDMLINPDGKMSVHLIHEWPRNAIKVTTKESLRHLQWQHVSVVYDGSAKAKGLQVFVNGRKVAVNVNVNALRGSTLTKHPTWLGYRSYTKRFAGLITDLRIFDRQLKTTEIAALIQKPVGEIVKIDRKKRNVEQQEAVDDIFRATFANEFAEAERKIKAKRQERQKFDQSVPTTMVMKERAKPRDCFVLKRGQYDQPDKSQRVFPATPEFLPKPKAKTPANRLGLARWLIDPKNPLTARVAVNRYWQRMFGTGLVGTPEDFGVQAPLPSHPELLDWLASEFVRSRWNVKAMQKMIVMSATYRQSSYVSPAAYRADPKNEWLARGPRFRLSAEQLRDNALLVSGLLVEKIGGPSIKPYQPSGLWRELAGGAGQGPYKMDAGEKIYRRSLYIYRKRTVPPPSMTTFDGGSREICQVSRPRTNTPLQALALLNDPTYLEAARVLAERALTLENKNVDERIAFMFRRATSRSPKDEELILLKRSLENKLRYFEARQKAAREAIAAGKSKPNTRLQATDLAAYMSVASVILNLDETLTKE